MKPQTSYEYVLWATRVLHHAADALFFAKADNEELFFNSLFNLCLELDNAPKNVGYYSYHPITDLVFSISSWSEYRKTDRSVIRGIGKLLQDHSMNRNSYDEFLKI